MEHMVNAVVFAGLLIGCKVSGILYYHYRLMIPLVAASNRAQLLIRQGIALPTVAHLLFGLQHDAGQALHLLLGHVDNMKRESLSRFRAYAGKLGQFFDQRGDLVAVIVHNQKGKPPPKPPVSFAMALLDSSSI